MTSEQRNLPRGALIAIEGLDRAGKSTQCALLFEKLKAEGYRTELVRFPDRSTATGKIIDQYLKKEIYLEDHAIHLLFSANRWEVAEKLLGLLHEDKTTILLDRYYASGAVYSAAKNNPDLSLEWARSPDIGLPKVDLTVFLSISPEEAQKRGGYGNERYEKEEMQKRVKVLFDEFRTLNGSGADWQVVDGGRESSVVQTDIWTAVRACLSSVESGKAQTPIGKFGI